MKNGEANSTISWRNFVLHYFGHSISTKGMLISAKGLIGNTVFWRQIKLSCLPNHCFFETLHLRASSMCFVGFRPKSLFINNFGLAGLISFEFFCGTFLWSVWGLGCIKMMEFYVNFTHTFVFSHHKKQFWSYQHV